MERASWLHRIKKEKLKEMAEVKQQSTVSSFKKTLNKKAISNSGQKELLYSDVTSEYDSELQGNTGSCNFKIMSKSDTTIGGIISSYKNPILSANWVIEEIPDATEDELKTIEVLNSWFFDKTDFGTLLNSILDMLPIGFSLFEQYYTKYSRDNSVYMMPILSERVQQSIYRIDYDKEIVEQRDSQGSIIEIPFSSLVFFTFRKEGNDRRGVSLLRNSYYDYKDKKEIKVVAKKGITRGMLGLPVGKVPISVGTEDEAYKDFEDLVIDLGSREDNALSDSAIIPENYTLEILKTDFKIEDLKEYLAYYDSSMVMSVLTQFLTLGQGSSGGSYTLGRDQSDMFLDGLQFVIDYIEEIFNKEIIEKTVFFNFPNVDPTKFKLRGLNLNKKNNKEFADTIKVLLDSGIIKARPEDEVMLRNMYKFPPIDLEEIEKEQEQEKVEEKKIEAENPVIEEEQKTTNQKNGKVIKLSESWTGSEEREVYLAQETEKLTKYSRASLTLISDILQQAIRRQLKKGEVESQGLKDIQINSIGAFKKGLGKKLGGIAKKSWTNAEKNSRNIIKLSEVNPSELPSNVLTSFVINQADLTAEKMVNDLREAGLLSANTSISKGYSVNQSMAQVGDSMDKVIESNNIDVGSELSIVQSMNYSEMQYYKSIEDNLWGYRFSNVAPVTAICRASVGKTYRKDSLELTEMSPPLHFRCKSYYAPIYKNEDKPDFDNFIPPPSIMEQKKF